MADEQRLLDLVKRLREVDAAQTRMNYEGIRWGQDRWRAIPTNDDSVCGTTMCAAGWTVQIESEQTGQPVRWLQGYLLPATEEEIRNLNVVCTTTVQDEDGELLDEPVQGVRIPDRAMLLLDLTPVEAEALFYCETDIDEVEQVVTEIIRGDYR